MSGGRRIRVRGLVQGVGFRPHVWRLANEDGLTGEVSNDGAGVRIDLWGPAAALDAFVLRLRRGSPPLARVDAIDWEPIGGEPAWTGFRIAPSTGGDISTGVVPDAATCLECLAEVMDPADRRYRYPFTNCTHCGPRLSIVETIPYDRARTSMRAFAMCAECRREYEDPADRRFHAQPNACPVCGPKVWLEDRAGLVACDDPLAETAKRLRAGWIAAIKGIGGFHLACDATNEAAVAELRRRKRRAAKPFALMAGNLEEIRRHCAVTDEEAVLLGSAAAPIVLLENRGAGLPAAIAPGQSRTGFMLPYSPLHHLLMAGLESPIVLTSANLSDEPQATDNGDALSRLSAIADIWLMHDRDIVTRLDDFVVRNDRCGPQVLRRARGLAPESLPLPPAFSSAPPVLAVGGELKSAFCLLKGGQAVLSQHLGDLEEAATHFDFRRSIALYREMFRFDPAIVAVDLHPDYLSTRWGRALAAETGARLVEVQHHHAHLASCLAENAVEPGDDFAVGVVLDGLGLGIDGTVWGGEFLLGGYAGFRRVGHFVPVALPGGTQAMREPWRNLVAHLAAAFGHDWAGELEGTTLGPALASKSLGVVSRMIAGGVNAPLSSSAGRLFDAVAACVGVCFDRQHYEGQAAMELETLAAPHLGAAVGYTVAMTGQDGIRVLSWRPMWQALLTDLRRGCEPGLVAARFHLGLVDGLADIAATVASDAGTRRIALSGGVMQNRIVLEALHARLTSDGFAVLVHARVPANDGGLALGQAAIAAASGWKASVGASRDGY